MKKKIFSAAAALVLSVSAAAMPANAAFFDLDAPSSAAIVSADDDPPYFDDYYEFVKYVRENLREKKDIILLNVKNDLDTPDPDSVWLVDMFKPTDRTDEGDYLFLTVKELGFKSSDDEPYGKMYVQYYMTADEETETAAKCKELAKQLNTAGSSDYEKTKAVYDYITANVEYIEDKSDTLPNCTAYSAAFNKKANSRGMAQFMIRILSEMGVNCRMYITNYDDDGCHFLVAVKLGDKYCLCDPSLDSAQNNSQPAYFLRGTEDIDELAPAGNSFGNHEYFDPHSSIDSLFIIQKDEISAKAYSPSERMKGDINDNRIIDAVDASAVLTAYAKASANQGYGFNDDQMKAADVNNDTIVDAKDASIILSYYAFCSVDGNDATLSEFIQNRANSK